MQRLLTKSQRIVVMFGAWVFLSLALLVIFDNLSYEYLFVLCLIGFLVIAELSGPFSSKPGWRSRVNVVILIGLIGFSLIVVQKVLEILGIMLF